VAKWLVKLYLHDANRTKKSGINGTDEVGKEEWGGCER